MTRSTRLPLPALLLTVAALLTPAQAGFADDTVLFTNAVAPNVMLLVDNSGSMNHIVWHPAYDPTVANTCSHYDETLDYYTSSNVTITRCSNTRTVYHDSSVPGSTRITGHYLNWYFSDAADPYFKGGTNNDSDNIDGPANGQRSQCLIDEGQPATYARFKRKRVSASKDVLREVICQVNLGGNVRFGLTKFYDASDPKGGYVGVPIADYTTAHGAAIETFISGLAGETWTPLAESLYNVYRYFQSRTNPIDGVDSNPFPVYNLDTSGNTVSVSNAPATPVQAECQKNFVVIITDGEPTKDDFDGMAGDFHSLVGDYNPDNALPEAGDEEPGGSCSYCNETHFYLDDLAKFMQDFDFQLDFPDKQVIDVYTVGFTTSPSANELLDKTAQVGNGFFRHSNNAEELANDLIDQILDIVDKSQSFTSATVPASRTTDGESFYSSHFRPRKDSPFWDGHLKAFKFTQAGDILTANDKCAIADDTLSAPCPTQGSLLTEALGVWDAADVVPVSEDRKLFTGGSALGFGTASTKWFVNSGGSITHTQDRNTLGLVTAPDAELAKKPFLLPDPNSNGDLDALAPKLVSQIAGCQFGTLLGTDCAVRVDRDGNASQLGDIFHSNPLAVGPPNAPINEYTYQQFASDPAHRKRMRVIYAGSNDGWLHGFNSGTWDLTLVPPRHNRGDGVEVMGFMPTEIRETIWKLPVSQPFGTVRSYVAVDGSAVAADVWLYRGVDIGTGELNSTLLPAATYSRKKEQWKTVLIGGLRDGGRSYYAIDVTDPADAKYPRYLWDFPCQDCASAINDKTDDPIAVGGPSAKQLMGRTWSEPVITRVRVYADGAGGFHERWVAVVGAGYDPCGDPHTLEYWQTGSSSVCDAADADKYSRGRAIMMIDITTGELLAVKAFHTTDLSIDGGQVGYDEMKYAVASQPAVYDLDFDGYADVIYIGDLGGNMWKWVVSPVGHDPINNTLTNKSLGQPNWPFEIFFHASHSDESGNPPSGAPNSSTHFQSFFFPPTALLTGTKLTLAWGAGERADSQRGTIDAITDDENDLDNNHFYVVKDTDPKSLSGSSTLYEGDLVPIADIDDGSVACQNVGKGYYVTGRDMEKFLTNSVIFLGEVITGSYLPAPPSASACDASGESFLYRFDLECGTGAYPSNPGGADDKRRKAIGGGLPTRPRVSVGDLNAGGGGGTNCNNRLIVLTSDAAAINEAASCGASGIGIRTWHER